MPLPPPTGGRDTPEIKEFRRRHPNCDVYIDMATCDGSTNARGQHQDWSPVNNDDVDDGGDNNNNSGGATKIPDGVGDKFKAPVERGEAEFGSLRVTVSPLLGSGLVGGGGSQNANNGDRRSLQSQREKNQRGHRRRGG
jgi:hypothetical protein